MQITVDKRVGFARFLGAYTFGKSLDDASSYTMSANPFILGPVGNFAACNFGEVTGANAGRIGQVALRIVF